MTESPLDPHRDLIDRLLEQLNVNSVFGRPARAGDLTVIPVAEITTAFGYGVGRGPAASAGDVGMAGGRGAGGGGHARPLGYIRMAPDGVAFEPMLDLPRISLAGILLAGWLAFWIAQTIRTIKLSR